MVRNVLVIEDDRGVLRAVLRLLRVEGYVTWSVTSMASALALERRFDVGVFDIALGPDDGLELARLMLEQNRVRRAIFFTGCTDPERLDAAHALGIVVLKGAPPEQLLHALGSFGPMGRESELQSIEALAKLRDALDAKRN